MSDTEQIEFTDREKVLVSYYRSPELVNSPGIWAYDLAFILASLTAAAMFIRDHEMAWAFAAYFLLLGRLCYMSIEAQRWSKVFHNIFKKYDRMLAEVAEEPASNDRGNERP